MERELPPRDRDPFLSAAGSFFFPGLGQIYSGRILRGIAFLIPSVLLTILQVLMQMSVHWFGFNPPLYTSWSYLYALIFRLVDFAVRGIAIYDAYSLAKLTQNAYVEA